MEKIWMKSWPDFLSKEPVYPQGEKPVFEYLRNNARSFPNRVAINFYGREVTYGELDEMSERFANFLVASGIRKGDRIALFLQTCPQYHIAYYGITKMGGVMVPCSPVFKEWELTYQLKDSGARAIVLADLLYSVAAGSCKECGIETMVLTSLHDYLPQKPTINLLPVMDTPKKTYPGTFELLDILKCHPATLVPAEVAMTDTVQFQYTGGTTGLPKGAILTHRGKLFKVAAAMNVLYASLKFLGHRGDEIMCLSPFPIFNIAGQLRSVDAMIALGATQVLLAMYDPIAAMQAVDLYKIHYFHTTVPMNVGIINHPERRNYDLSSLILAFTSSFGIQLNEDIVRQWKEVTQGCALTETAYGLSETHTGDTFMPVNRPKYERGCMGLPLAGSEIKIVYFEDRSREVPLGEVGEIALKHPAVFSGYWNRPEETKNTLVDGWVYTGDMGKFDDEGYLYFLGRKKDMIKTSGFSVFPEEVELFLNRHEAVEKVAVIGVPDEKKGEIIKAFIVPKAQFRNKVQAADIIAWTKDNISPYKVPKAIEFVDDLPMSGAGKVLRRVLLDLELKKKE